MSGGEEGSKQQGARNGWVGGGGGVGGEGGEGVYLGGGSTLGGLQKISLAEICEGVQVISLSFPPSLSLSPAHTHTERERETHSQAYQAKRQALCMPKLNSKS